MPKTQHKAVGIKWVTKHQLRKVLDARCQRVLGVSGEAFTHDYCKGALGKKSLDGKAGTVELATLCFFTRESSAKAKSRR
jgi:hypothetical protein